MHFKARTAVEAAVSAARELTCKVGRNFDMRNATVFRQRLILLLTLCAHPLLAGVVLDGSFGKSGPLPGPNFTIPKALSDGTQVGKQVGGNLFQSFSQFNLNSSQSATFTGPNTVHNILARVTSGSPSSIDGKIKIDRMMGDANLFFMNPAGVLFGKNAQLDVRGSFAVTTANYLNLVGGGRFNAKIGDDSMLSSAPVSAFGFLNNAPGPVFVTDSTLKPASQKVFSAVAGDITLSGGKIIGEGSRVNLVSVKSPGKVQLDPANINSAVDVSQFPVMGTISLADNALIDTEGLIGGPISIQGGNLNIDSSQIFSRSNYGALPGGNLTITIDKRLSMVRGGQIKAVTESSGKGGNISIHTESLSIDGSATPGKQTGILEFSDVGATGATGNLDITVDKLLSIVGPQSQISARTSSNGNGGNVKIHAASLSINGLGSPDSEAGILAFSENNATGDAGELNITVDKLLTILGGGLISAATFTSGHGGDVTVHTRSLSIDGSAAPNHLTGITADANTPGAGDAGDATITVDKLLSIVSAGTISARTLSNGNGGDLTIHAGSLSIDGGVRPGETGIFVLSDSNEPTATGDAGKLRLTVDGALNIVGGGFISASTITRGRGGDATIHAGSLLIDGSDVPDDIFTGIEADSGFNVHATDAGDAGSVTIRVDKALSVVGSVDAGITAGTFLSGKGGNLTIYAGSLLIDNLSQIFAESTGSGIAGNVFIQTAGPVTLKHEGQITTRSTMTDAGFIHIISGGKIKLKDHSKITVSAPLTDGGNITIETPVLMSLINSDIDATAGKTGGNITIDPIALQLKDSTINASAGIQGGHIDLFTSFLVGPVKTVTSDGGLLLAFHSSITATGGTSSGTVNVTAPSLDLGAQLITLPTSLLSAENQLQERCAALLRGDFSSFISIGRGGTEPAPEELQTTF
jgi:filamentous hemagglutinin family protein